MRRVKWGIIGAGGIADRRTIPAMLKAANCEPVALMDVKNNEALSKKYGLPCYDNEDELLSYNGLDAVYIATPVHLHLKQIEKAAGSGKHILVEKPLAMNSAEAVRAVTTCRQAGVLLMEGYMMRFHGAHKRIREIIETGEIGKPVYARAQLACWYPPLADAWRQEPEKGGGGALIDMATHLYDLLEMFLGPITKVASFVNSQVHHYPVEDSATTLLLFESGAHGTVDSFFCIPDEASRTRLEIYGSKGSILAEGTIGQGSGGFLEVYLNESAKGYETGQAKDSGGRFREEKFTEINPYTAELEYFSSLVLEGKKEVEINSGGHGVHILKIVEAAYKSSESGRMIVV